MTFEQILGHDRQKEFLRRALTTGRLAHAYLFSGPDGVGKRLMALALARGMACHEQRGCGHCQACRKIDHQNHPDLHIVEPEGNTIKIEQIRSLQKDLNLKPLEAPRKICLIENVERMTSGASNSLLKTLEEPNGDALIILLTAQPEQLLQTIRSRCQHLPFSSHPVSRIQSELEKQLQISETESHVLAALSEGSFKKAFGKDRELYIEQRRELLKTLTGLSSGSILPILDFAERLATDKVTLPEILEMFQAFYRDVMMTHQGRSDEQIVNLDLKERIQLIARNESIGTILVKLEALVAARRQLDRNVNRQLVMEVLLFQLVNP
jgi:DNA polymerase-3 subunit delta'